MVRVYMLAATAAGCLFCLASSADAQQTQDLDYYAVPGNTAAPAGNVGYNATQDTQFVPASHFRGGSSCGCQSACDCGAAEGACGCEDDACGGCGAGGGTCFLFGPNEAAEAFPGDNVLGMKIGGWFQAGYHNKQTPNSAARGDLGAFNDVPGTINLQQSWIYAERVANGEDGWDWGFRGDLVYGTDAQKTQAFGGDDWDNDWDNGVYGWALPQAYFEIANGRTSVKVGHFFTLVGYEVVTAPDNFFYSHSLTMFNSEPFTHTGALATWTGDNITLYGGWTAGWDTGFEQFNDGSNFLGGFSVNLLEDVAFTYILTAGNFGRRGDDGYSHSLLFDVTLTDNLTYILQSDFVRVDSTGDEDVGINQYLIYSFNDCIGVGARVEWWQDDFASQYEATFGVNVRPHANFVLRPEIRHDWNPGANFDQTTFGIDGIFTF